jgi:hypothetical protein
MWHPLWREDGSAVYNCCWSSPAQSFSGASPARLMTTFLYCLRFETPPTWRARSPYLYPPGTGWPDYTHSHWVPFSSPPTTCMATVEALYPASTRDNSCMNYFFLRMNYASFQGPVQTADSTPCLIVPLLFCITVATVIRCCGNNVYLAVV